MNQKTEQLLRELADKFETTTEHLWEVMIQQASITAPLYAIAASFLIGVTFIAWCFVMSKTTPRPNSLDSSRPHKAEWKNEEAVGVWAILISVTAVVIGLVSYLVFLAATAALNPEYWALQQILELR